MSSRVSTASLSISTTHRSGSRARWRAMYASASCSGTGSGPVARSHTAVPSAERACASTLHRKSRLISFSRIAPASGSPREVTATPIAARSQRRISALTRIALFSRGSMAGRRAGGFGSTECSPRQPCQSRDVAVAVDRQEVALVEQNVGRAAVAATQLGDAVFGAGELGFEAAAQIGLPRGQSQQRVAALAVVGETEAPLADGGAQRGRRHAGRAHHDGVVAKRDLLPLGGVPGADKWIGRRERRRPGAGGGEKGGKGQGDALRSVSATT